MRTWKSEKARLERNGVEFPKPNDMHSGEKVEIQKIQIVWFARDPGTDGILILNLDSSRFD